MGKVIYIMSAGHSGSTLLDMAIGSIKGVFSAGEMVHLPWQIQRGANPRDQQTYCSCGNDFTTCPVWRKVIDRLGNKKGVNLYEQPEKFNLALHLQGIYGNKKKSVWATFIKNAYRYKLSKWVLLPVYILFYRTIKNYWMLIDEICEVTKAEYVVDSSKDMARYLLLKMMRPKEVKLIVLIRGVHGVVSSHHAKKNVVLTDDILKKRAEGWVRLYKKYIYPIIQNTAKDDFLVVRYEAFCQNPNEYLDGKVKNFLKTKNKRVSTINTYDYHLVAGNPMRHSGEITIRKDLRWKERLTPSQIAYLDAVEEKLPLMLKKQKKTNT